MLLYLGYSYAPEREPSGRLANEEPQTSVYNKAVIAIMLLKAKSVTVNVNVSSVNEIHNTGYSMKARPEVKRPVGKYHYKFTEPDCRKHLSTTTTL